jgi:hypothetical protein
LTNARVISLFALNPIAGLGVATVAVSIVGMTFVAASLLSFVRVHGAASPSGERRRLPVRPVVLLVIELSVGLHLDHDPSAVVNGLAIVIIVSFIIGIGWSWETRRSADRAGGGAAGSDAIRRATGRRVGDLTEDAVAAPTRPVGTRRSMGRSSLRGEVRGHVH